jgi:hypothetical protein
MEIQINGISIIHAANGSITIRNGELIVDGKVIHGIKDLSNVTIQGNVQNLNVTGAVHVEGRVTGRINAGGSVTCGDVVGDIDAGGSVTANNIDGDIDAGGSVHVRRK